MIIKRILYVTFLFNYLFVHSQKVDSLRQEIRKASDEKNRLTLLLEITDALINDPSDTFQSYLDSSYILAKEIDQSLIGKIKLFEGVRLFRFGKLTQAEEVLKTAISKLEKSGDHLDIANANHYLASTYANQDDYYTSIEYYEIAKAIYAELGNDEWLSKVLSNMGWSYRERGDLDKAMEVFMEALGIAESNNSLAGLFDVYHELGYIYIEQGDTSEAEKTFKTTLEIAEQLESKERISYANGDLAILYFKKKDFDRSLAHNKADLEIQISLGNDRDLPMIYNNISDCFFELKDYDSTIFYANKALEVDTDQRSTYENAQSKINIAKSKVITKDYFNANVLLNEALEEGNKIASIDVKRNALNQLYLLARKTNNYERALAYFESYHALQDSIFNLDTNKQIEEIKAAYELDKSHQKITNLDLERQNAIGRRNLYFVAFLLMVVIGIILFLYNRLIRIKNGMIVRRERKIADAKLEKARSELMLYTKMLAEKNSLINKLNNEYDKVKGEIKLLAPDSSKKIKKLIKSSLLTDAGWDEFKERFEQIYPNFFLSLRDKYEGLTNTEEKLFALSKLKLKNKEIASMLGVSPGSVAKSKNRLGKKLEVKPDEISKIAAII